ncbi:hypothetical protein OPQ81_000492 [Rhizoctonia solani]|nr:hypothetical protein OPQ81_000492 [Rhizoctonia solani]
MGGCVGRHIPDTPSSQIQCYSDEGAFESKSQANKLYHRKGAYLLVGEGVVDALMSWEFSRTWPLNLSRTEVEQPKANTTKTVQEFGNIARLNDVAYFNEANPLEAQRRRPFLGLIMGA